MSRRLVARAAPGVVSLLVLAGCARRVPLPRTSLDDEPPRLVSAFFGLDRAMPEASRGLCWEAPGQSGLPVTFSRRVVGSIAPASFTIRTRSGALLHPACATTKPADAPGKNHTVLLIGELGGEPADPPVGVEITGPLPLEGGDGKGLSVPVTPLAAGPTLVLALSLAPGSVASDCPSPRTGQIVVAIWAGGVKPGPGSDEESHRTGYRVTTSAGDVTPFALGDLGDRDNYVHLCLDTVAPAVRVSQAAGLLVDPRGDVNPGTSVAVSAPR